MEEIFSQRRNHMLAAIDHIKGPRKMIMQQKIIDEMRLFGDDENDAGDAGVLDIEDRLKKLGLDSQLAPDEDYAGAEESDSERESA